MSNNTNTVLYIPSDPEEQKKIFAVFKDMSDQKTKSEAINDYLKEAKKQLKEDYDIPASVIGKMFSIYHKENASNYFEEQTEMQELYETIFGATS